MSETLMKPDTAKSSRKAFNFEQNDGQLNSTEKEKTPPLKLIAWQFAEGTYPAQIDELWHGSKKGDPCVFWREDDFGQSNFEVKGIDGSTKTVNLAFVGINRYKRENPWKSDEDRRDSILQGLKEKDFIQGVLEIEPDSELGQQMTNKLLSKGQVT